MTESVSAPGLDVDGPAAPPRQNGELVFESPWESRLFGLTLALCDQGVLDWHDFRRQLIRQIGDFERESTAEAFHYYRHWQAALESVVDRRGLCSRGLLRARAEQLAARPHGHDH